MPTSLLNLAGVVGGRGRSGDAVNSCRVRRQRLPDIEKAGARHGHSLRSGALRDGAGGRASLQARDLSASVSPDMDVMSPTGDGPTARVCRSLVVLLLVAWFAAPVRAVELAPEIEVDRLLVRAERQMRDGEYPAAAATLDEMIAKAEEHAIALPEVVWLRHGEVSLEVGRPDVAAESATRYLQVAGRSAEHYRLALELLDEVDRERGRLAEREAIRAAAEPLRQLNGDISCTRVFEDLFDDTTSETLIREVTEVDFSGECRLTIRKRDTWDDGLRIEEDVDTTIGPGNVITAWTEESQCGTFLGLRFGRGELVEERTWRRDGRFESTMGEKIYLPFELGQAHDEASIMETIRTLNNLCARRTR